MSDQFEPPPPPPPAPAAFTAPAALAPPAPTYAGFWIRVVAVLIDAVILFLLGLGAGVVIRVAAGAPAIPRWRSGWMDDFSGLGCAQQSVKFVVWWLYHALFESSATQATPGKQALGLKVTDLYGRRISFARAAARTLAKVLSTITIGIGYVMAAFTLRKQALHDFVAETVVLRGWRG